MIADNIKAFNNATLNYDLKFSSKIQNNKLIINAMTQDDKFEYLGEFANQDMDLQDVKELIDLNKVKIITKTQNLLKIKVAGAIPIQLIRIIKEEPKNQTLIISELLKNHTKLESQIKEQNSELNLQKTLMQEFQAKIDSFMSNTNAEIISLKSFSKNMENLQKLTVKKFDQFESKYDKQQKKLEQLFEIIKNSRHEKDQILGRKVIQNFEKQINELKKQIHDLKINQQKKSQKYFISVSMFTQEKQGLQKKILNNTTEINQIKTSLNQRFECVKQKLDVNSILIDNLKKQLTKNNQSIKNLNMVSQQSIQQKEQNNSMKEERKFQKVEPQFKIEESLPQFYYEFVSNNESIRQSKWSSQLKSNGIKINDNVVTRTSPFNDYCDSNLICTILEDDEGLIDKILKSNWY